MHKVSYTGSENRIPWSPILVGLLVMAVIVMFGFSWKRWEGGSPTIRLSREFKALGRNPSLSLVVQDQRSGLKRLTVVLKQEAQSVSLIDEEYIGPGLLAFWKIGDRAPKEFDLGQLIASKVKMRNGPATLDISATDRSYRNFLRGNETRLHRDFAFQLNPPRLEVISGQHYINQGGSECVVYRVAPQAIVSGVRVGANFFPGYPVPGSADKDQKFALFAFTYNESTATIPRLVARDEAGNEAVAGFSYKLFPKKFRSSILNLNDSFLQKVVPEILSHTTEVQDQGNTLKTFLVINSKLRTLNHQLIRQLSEKSAHQFLWKGAFLQLSNSQVESLFADHRTYVYEGKVVDHQDHVGFDLSAVKQYPIEAANDGIVLYADYLGIYGNCVLIDHGYGLVSLYGHMSSIDVKPGQAVKKRQVIGRSGETGLAGGDHLHFGLFLDGVPVNPTEWWDQHWIQDHIDLRFKS